MPLMQKNIGRSILRSPGVFIPRMTCVLQTGRCGFAPEAFARPPATVGAAFRWNITNPGNHGYGGLTAAFPSQIRLKAIFLKSQRSSIAIRRCFHWTVFYWMNSSLVLWDSMKYSASAPSLFEWRTSKIPSLPIKPRGGWPHTWHVNAKKAFPSCFYDEPLYWY